MATAADVERIDPETARREVQAWRRDARGHAV
jgi:hypothetical protein